MINILIGGSQTLIREGVTSVLSSTNNIHISGYADTWGELEVLINRGDTHVIIIDHQFINHFSIEDLKNIGTELDFTHLLVISDSHHKNDIIELVEHGIKNHVSRECAPEELVQAVYATAKAEEFYCSKTFQTLFGNKVPVRESENIPSLSQREAEIIQLISVGLSNKEIAEKLFLSFHTIKTHRKNIIRKLGFTFKNASELALLMSYLNDMII